MGRSVLEYETILHLPLRAVSHQSFTMSHIIQMDCTCIEKNTVSGIRLSGQTYQANLVSEPGSAATTLLQILGLGGLGPLFRSKS